MPPQRSTQQVILHVEDDDGFAALVGELLTDADFRVYRTSTLTDGEQAAASEEFACAFVDLELPDASGLQAVSALRRASPELPLVVLSGQQTDTAPVKAVLLGAQDWVAKDDISTRRLSQAATLAIARRDAQAEAVWEAAHDQVTGLANRSMAHEHLLRALDRTRRRDTQLAVLFCDLDDFKAINDRHGHPAGDHVLRCVAHRVMDAVRPGDMVARWGGDEFIVIAEDLASARAATAIADRIRVAVAAPLTIADDQIIPMLTIGVALTTTTTDANELIAGADHAMLDAKRNRTGSAATPQRGRITRPRPSTARRARAM